MTYVKPRKVAHRVLFASAIAGVGGSGQPVHAAAIAAFAPPVGYAVLHSGSPSGAYDFTASVTNWNIAQWGTNNELPAFHLAPYLGLTPTTIVSKALSGRVVLSTANTGATEVGFSQNGTQVPCTTGGGAPNEYDLFMQPNQYSAPSQQSAYLAETTPGGSSLLNLGNMSSLTSSGTYRTAAAWRPATTSSCAVNQATSMVAFVFVNRAVTPPQVFFYQLNFNRICEPGANYAVCSSTVAPFFYFNGVKTLNGAGTVVNALYGMDDQITSYGIPMVQNDLPLSANFNLLPRLTAIIQAQNTTMDHNINDWALSGFYLGQHIWGDVALASEFTGFVPMITPKGLTS